MPGISVGRWEGAKGAFVGILKGHVAGTASEESQVFEVGAHLTDQSRRKLMFPATAPQPGHSAGPMAHRPGPRRQFPLPSASVSNPDGPPLKQTCGVPSVPSTATSVPLSPPGGSATHSRETPGRWPCLPSHFQVCEMGYQVTNGLYLRGRHRQTHRNVTLPLQMHLN